MFDDTKILDAMVKYIKEKKMVPWESGLISSLSARGGLRANGQPYRGINAMLTMMYIEMGGYDSRIFLTHKEIESRGGHVKKGCKAYMVMYALWLWLDENGKRITEKEAKERKELGLPLEKKWGGYRFYNVFSICDTTLEYDKGEKGVISPAEKIVECDDIVNGWEDCPRINHNLPMMAGASGCYSPGTDTITIPTISCFKTPAFYYGTLFHEMVHSTGHPKRLNRKMSGSFGSVSYSKEELVAEIGSAMLLSRTPIAEEEYIENHAEYVRSWESRIKSGKGFMEHLMQAWSKAEKAAEWIIENRKDGEIPIEEEKIG